MKAKVHHLVLAGIVASHLAGFAQETPTPTPAAPPPAADPGAVLTVTVDDQPLIQAIDILARRAEVNYMLDPDVAQGVVGADGKVIPHPNVSIRWEKVTARQALEALLDNHKLQLSESPKSPIARVTRKDPAAQEPIKPKYYQLKYTSPSNILAAVQTTLTDKRSKVVPEPRTSQLVVVATEKEQLEVEQLITRLDTPTKQVLIEAKILETTVNPKSSKGVDWSGTLTKQNVTFGNGLTTGTRTTTTTSPGTPVTTTQTLPGGRTISSTTTPSQDSKVETVLSSVLGGGGLTANTRNGFSPHTAFLNADGLNVALSFLNSSADTKTISEPRMVTLDNQKATIDVGLMFPIVNVSASTANTTGGSQISYTNLTVGLDVTPRITANDFVELKVQQTILRLGPSIPSKVGGVENDVNSFFTRRLETGVLIPSGNTLVMGGLISDESISGNTKVPVLGDLPAVGLLFRKDSKERNRQNLIIFITPTIVKDDDFQAARSKFLKSTADEGAVENWSAWDSGKPRDWSNPDGTPQPEAIFDEDLGKTPPASTPRPQLSPN